MSGRGLKKTFSKKKKTTTTSTTTTTATATTKITHLQGGDLFRCTPKKMRKFSTGQQALNVELCDDDGDDDDDDDENEMIKW